MLVGPVFDEIAKTRPVFERCVLRPAPLPGQVESIYATTSWFGEDCCGRCNLGRGLNVARAAMTFFSHERFPVPIPLTRQHFSIHDRAESTHSVLSWAMKQQVSDRKRAANRANSQKSTGPKSDQGKQAVRHNAPPARHVRRHYRRPAPH